MTYEQRAVIVRRATGVAVRVDMARTGRAWSLGRETVVPWHLVPGLVEDLRRAALEQGVQ